MRMFQNQKAQDTEAKRQRTMHLGDCGSHISDSRKAENVLSGKFDFEFTLVPTLPFAVAGGWNKC